MRRMTEQIEAGTTLVVLPGENLRRGQGEEYLRGKTRMMGPSAKINAIAVGVLARELGTEYVEVLTQAGDAAGIGITEAQQNADYLLVKNPELQGRIHLEEDSFDSPSIANNANSFVQEANSSGNGYKEVELVDIDSHRRRLYGQMKAWEVPLDGSYSAEKLYVNDPRATESTKVRRQRVVNRIHRGVLSVHKTTPHDIFNPKKRAGLISKQMLLERALETGLNVIGLIDNRGLIAQRLLTSRSRKNA